MFEELTPNAEKLLQEIIDHRNEKGNCDSNYWQERFNSIDFSEEMRLRSLFGELKEAKMISVQWADNYPYFLFLSDRGLSYNELKKGRKSMQTEHKEYDVFISHANKDKSDYVDSLYMAIRKLGVSIFYDSEVLSWGDNWKNVILEGTEKSEFAIIVISENFFDREWTERELTEFLKRQNTSGQKIVLPLLHNISLDMLKEKYPALGDIQVISTEQFSKEEITVLFAKELIKRLKT